MTTNFYIYLKLHLDPPITDADAMEVTLRRLINECNKRINTPGSQYRQMVQLAHDIIPILKRLNLSTLAREASVAIMKELRDDINNLKESGAITEDCFKRRLKSKYHYYFSVDRLRSECGMAAVVRTTGRVIPKPVRPQTLKCATTVSLMEMEIISNDLSIVSGNPSDLYELLGVPRTTAIEELYEKAQDDNNKNQRQTNKTAEVDAKNRLYGKCLAYFKSKEGKAKYDAALYRFPFDRLAKSAFELRCDQGTITPRGYYQSVHDTVQAGYTPDEAAYLVYEFYVLKKKSPPPEEFIPDNPDAPGFHPGTACVTSTFSEFLGRLIRLVHESEKYNSANRIGEALQHLREKLVGLRQSKHLSDIQIQCEVQSLFGDLQKWRKNDRTHTGQFWIVTQWSRWKELDVNTLKHAGNYPDLASLSAFHQDITMLLGTIQ